MLTITGDGNCVYESDAIRDCPNVKITITGNNNLVQLKWENAENCRGGMIYLTIEGNHNHVVIDEIIVDERLIICIVDYEHVVKIGKGSSFVDTTISIADNKNSVLIGNDCMFSRGITMLTSDFHSIVDLNTNNRINWGEDIVIEDHVWIGIEAMVLKGAAVGHSSIVAARAIVTQPIPAYSIAMGAPAKQVRSGMTWERTRRKNILPDADISSHQYTGGSIRYNLEKFDVNLQDRLMEGWAYIEGMDNSEKEGWIDIIYQNGDEIKNFSIALYIFDRIDVADYFNNDDYLYSGFRGYVPIYIQEIKRIILYLKVGLTSYGKVIYNDIQ